MPAEDASKETRARRRELLAVYLLCVVLLASLGVLWLRQRGYLRSAPLVEHTPEARVEKPIDLNRAPWWELMQIRGVGEKRAKEIVALRERKVAEQKRKPVGFTDIDELAKELRWMTPDILDDMRKEVRVEPLSK